MSKLPNAECAVVDIEKLRDYCLNLGHPRGGHKALVFASVLGIRMEHAETLRRALLAAAVSGMAIPGEVDAYGSRYVIDFPMRGPLHAATVRSIWIVRRGEDFPRLATCYVL